MTDFETPISPESLRRQEAILLLARAEARRRRQRRVARNVAWSVGLILAGLSITRWEFIASRNSAQPVPPMAVGPRAKMNNPAIDHPSAAIEYFHTDPSIAARLTIPPAAPQWHMIDDDAFLKTLADAGQPAGIIRVQGRSILMVR
jgi:hypothetical protein